MLECVGQCFSLPLDYAPTIDSSLQIYKNWFLDAKKQPPPIKQDEQFFYKEMFKHLSLIFTPRQAELTAEEGKLAGREQLQAVNEDISIHTKFCETALSIYRSVGVKYSRQLTDDTWECLLKIVLGICDSMLSEPRKSSILAEKLVPDLINILFELWLTSGRRPPVMWDKLSELAKKWKHRIQTFSYWSAVCTAINDRVLQILYGPSHGTSAILFRRVDGEIVELTLDDSYVFTCWYRMLHLLGSFEGSVSFSENYFEAIKGIGKIARSYIELNKKKLVNAKGQKIPPPSGNTILDMCGGWLFEAINNFQKGFENGKKEALETICSLFSSRPSHEFHSKYLAHYYRGIEKALNTHNTPLLDVIVRNSTPFFLKQYRGSHVLIPSFVISFGRVLFTEAQGSIAKELSVTTTHSSQSINLNRLQKASLQIIYSLLCLGSHYKDCVFNCSSTQSVPLIESLPTLTHFVKLNEHIGELLLAALENVKTEECRIMALWGACIFSFEIIDTDIGPKYANRFISLLLEKVITGHWEYDEVRVALLILRDLSFLYPYLGAELALVVVTTSCTFITNRLSKLDSSNAENLIFIAMEVCLDWIIVDQWVHTTPECVRVLVTTAEKGMTYEQKGVIDPKSGLVVGKRIKQAAEYFLHAFVSYFGNFPRPSGPESISSLRDEKSLIAESNGDLSKDKVVCCKMNSNVLTVCKFPKEKGTEVYCVTRDMLGRNIWRNKMNYFIQPVKECDPEKYVQISPTIIPAPVNIADVSKELDSCMTDADRRLHDETTKVVTTNNGLEQKILEKRKYGLDVDISISAPKPTYDKDDATLRLFCANFGLNSLVNWNHLLPVNPNFTSENVPTTFSQIDKLESRGCYSAGVLYFGDSPNPIFDLPEIPQDFNDFLWSLGWKIDVETHVGYKGGLSASKTGKTAPYYSSYNLQLIFQVGLLVPKNQISTNYMQSLIFSNQVVICWTENIATFNPNLFNTEFQLLIVIEPQETRLYRVKIFSPQTLPYLGPLQDEMILSKQVLGAAVRVTVLNAARDNFVCGEQSCHRLGVMEKDISSKNEPPKNLFKFYSSLLTT